MALTTTTVIEPGPGVISVGFMGDVNGDGFSDVAVGNPDACVDGVGVSGNTTVVYGQQTASANVDLSGIDSSTGIDIQGESAGGQTGTSVGGVDLNGVGTADIIVGSPGTDSVTGDVTVNLSSAVVGSNAGLTVTVTGGSTAVTENGTTDTISIALSSQPTADVVLTVSSSDTGEVTVDVTSLTFTTSNWDVPQTVTVTGIADGVVDTDQNVMVTFDPSSSDSQYNELASVNVDVTNQNIEPSTIPTRIFSPSSIVRPHTITASTIRSAIIFQAFSDTILSVYPVGTASASEIVRIVDANVQRVDQYSNGVATVSGQLYAIIFEAQSEDRIFTVQSTSGTDAFSTSASTNILQPTDTTGDGTTTAGDALAVINYLNRDDVQGDGEGDDLVNTDFLLNVNRDNRISALDALIVINELNRQQATIVDGSEGEFNAVAVPSSVLASGIAVASDDPKDDDSVPASLIEQPDDLISTPLSQDSVYSAQLVDDAILDDYTEDVVSDSEITLLASKPT